MKLMAKYGRWLKLGLAALTFVAIWGQPLAAQASTYGSGNYGNCAYSTGCAATSTPTPAAESPAPTPGEIILNDFSEYFVPGGKDLELSAGQVVYFDVTDNGTTTRHS